MATTLLTTGLEIGGDKVTAHCWAHFDGPAASIQVDYGVASISDLGTGSHRVTFSTAMSTANYAVSFCGLSSQYQYATGESPTTAQVDVIIKQIHTHNLADYNSTSVIVFGD